MRRTTIALVWLTALALVEARAAEESRSPAPRKQDIPETHGEFLGQGWHIDENHLMWWDGSPYVPFGGFGIETGNDDDLRAHNLWIDFDPFIADPKFTVEQHKRQIRERLETIKSAGDTCIVQFSMALPHIPNGPEPGMEWHVPEGGIDGSRLADPEVKEAIVKVWGEYAPVVRNPCVRAIVLWNEINIWRWPERMSTDQYAELLKGYVSEAKRLIGDVPICFKTAGTWNAHAAIAAAAAADGLGFDVWFSNPDDEHARVEIARALRMLETRQTKTCWFFIAEGGRNLGDDREPVGYPEAWPPFRSKSEAGGILEAYAHTGAKGFIYNGPAGDEGYAESYQWLGELKPEIVRLMTETKRPATERGNEAPAAEAIAAACKDSRVLELLKDIRSLRVEAEFSERWQVWLVHFFEDDRQVAFASVSPTGQVLEVGGPESDD
jgi:hypothetical protein